MASSEDDVLNSEPDLEDDLFGDEDVDEEPKAQKSRQLSDDELDSGDDEDRQDRRPRQKSIHTELEGATEDVEVMGQIVYRHPLPKPSDDEVSCESTSPPVVHTNSVTSSTL